MRVLHFKVIHKGKIIIDVDFSEESFKENNNYITLAIGNNGVGKSFILSQLAEVFRNMEYYPVSKSDGLKYDYYLVIYKLKNRIIKLEINNGKYHIDGILMKESLKDFLPARILALSFMINDKFTFQKNSDLINAAYRYLGIRQVSNASWTTSINKLVTQNVIDSLETENFTEQMKIMLKYLGFQDSLCLAYNYKRKTLFNKPMKIQTLEKLLASEKKKKYSSNFVKELTTEDLYAINNFIAMNGKNNDLVNDLEQTLRYYVDDLAINQNLKDNLKTLKAMQNLGLVEVPKIEFINKESFSIDYASSGEKNILHTVLNLLANVEDDSLILIDEPELSLHPEWQTKYITLIQKILNNNLRCHSILATHSHFMASDIDSEYASIVHVEINHDDDSTSRVGRLIPYSTYAWSAENILYKVFNLRTTRNYYFENDLKKLIDLINTQPLNKQLIRPLYINLNKYVLSSDDPLKLLMDEVKELLEND